MHRGPRVPARAPPRPLSAAGRWRSLSGHACATLTRCTLRDFGTLPPYAVPSHPSGPIGLRYACGQPPPLEAAITRTPITVMHTPGCEAGNIDLTQTPTDPHTANLTLPALHTRCQHAPTASHAPAPGLRLHLRLLRCPAAPAWPSAPCARCPAPPPPSAPPRAAPATPHSAPPHCPQAARTPPPPPARRPAAPRPAAAAAWA